MYVLVTGATGRVGANVVDRLSARGACVRAFLIPGDTNKDKLKGIDNVDIIEGDLRSQAQVNAACEGITHVVHLGAQLVRGNTAVDEYWDINAFGTLRLIEALVRNRSQIERFVLVSTDSVYRPGDPPARPIIENAPHEPCTYYGTGKLLSEVILTNMATQFGIPFSILRFSTVLSPEEAGNMFRLRSLRKLLAWQGDGKNSNLWQLFVGQPDLLAIMDAATDKASPDTAVSIVGPENASWTLHMVDVRDATDGVLCALEDSNAIGQAFNIAAKQPTSYVEGAAIISEIFGVDNVCVELPLTWQFELSVNAARDVLGFNAKYDFRSTVLDGLSQTNATYIPARANTGVAAIL